MTRILIFVIVAGFFLLVQTNAEHDNSRVVWVPVMERRSSEVLTVIDETLRKNLEKTERISKMLNKSIAVQEKERDQGTKKLYTIKHAGKMNSATSFSLILLPFGLLGALL